MNNPESKTVELVAKVDQATLARRFNGCDCVGSQVNARAVLSLSRGVLAR